MLGFSFFAGSLSAADAPLPAKAGTMRAGMIGLDTSHVIAFTQMLNDPKATGELAQLKIVAGYPGGSPDNPSSWDRVPQYTKELRGMGVEIVDSIDDLLKKVDVVLLMSVDGRPHLAQARPVIAAGKPLFIDKPMAASLADAMEIFRLAEEKHVPCFSASALRFSSGFQAARQKNSRFGDVKSCVAWSPLHLEPHHPDLFWYGIHGVETLYTIMGPGCQTVTRPRRTRSSASGPAAAREPSSPRTITAPRSREARRAGRPASSRAISRWWSRSSASSRRAGRRCPPPRRWRSWPSWRRPTRASVSRGPREH